MPENLRAAHDRNDETLERIYIGRRFKNDTERLEKLFEMYTKMTTKVNAAMRALRHRSRDRTRSVAESKACFINNADLGRIGAYENAKPTAGLQALTIPGLGVSKAFDAACGRHGRHTRPSALQISRATLWMPRCGVSGGHCICSIISRSISASRMSSRSGWRSIPLRNATSANATSPAPMDIHGAMRRLMLQKSVMIRSAAVMKRGSSHTLVAVH